MGTYQSGGDLAEIIIDYKAKTVDMLNPRDGNPFKSKWWAFHITTLGGISFAIICIILSWFSVPYLLYVVIGILIVHWLIGIIFPKYNLLMDKWNQKVFNDRLASKKLVIVNHIEGNTYTLPYEFKNIKFDVTYFGDFDKYKSKLHIKPKDYFIKSYGKIERQMQEWEAKITFDRRPESGKMEIEWI